jgi:uncharacterized protein (DUF1015 family)
MAEILPFRGIHFAQEELGSLESVVAPPYDVITPAQQDDFYAASDYNIIRIILNRPEPHDNAAYNPYTRAASYLREWLRMGVLVRDESPALYAYRQVFTHPTDRDRYTRTALFCAMKLEPYTAGVIMPHEETRAKAKEDRLQLIRATQANTEPIFGLFEDPEGTVLHALELAIADSPPDLQVTINGDQHQLWRIEQQEVIASVQEFLRPQPIWIADGHHRYETALAYRDERRAAEGHSHGLREYDYILIGLVSFNDPGLVVLPTHRLVRNIPAGRLEELYLLLERYFTIEPVIPNEIVARMRVEQGSRIHRFGLVQPGRSWVLTLRDLGLMDAAVEGYSSVWKQLDVSILQVLVLERSLGIPAASLATTPNIGYTRDPNEALHAVQSGEWQLALLLNPPSAEEVRRVASVGEKMPPKSTYFYPKLWSGLLLRTLD